MNIFILHHFGLGDFFAQHLEVMDKKRFVKVDKERIIKQISWGAVGTPITIFNIYILNRYFKVVGLKTLLGNLFILQFFISPCFLFSFFMYMNIYKGNSLKEGVEDFQKRFYNIWLDAGKFWPFINIINFYFVPYAYRVYFTQLGSLTWNVYMSYYMHTKSLILV